jgi:Lrp/AsnC family leucine-responsive transcriptional regulator
VTIVRLIAASRFDAAILRELSHNARMSHVELANRIGLSGTAIARRQRTMEESGLIRRYQAVLDLGACGYKTTVLVGIALDSQSEDTLKAFEASVSSCPSITRCFQMSGSDDYLPSSSQGTLKILNEFTVPKCRGCRGSRAFSPSFAIREVISRATPPAVFRTCC